MTQSWLLYFRSNQAEPREIPWHEIQPADPLLVPSLQQFQLGEGATGLTFLELGRRHAGATDDLDFVETLALFISEEQRHSGLLARYLRASGEPLLERHWVDGIFRRLRKVAGLECMVTVLVTAEILAVPYYRAVLRISTCPVLRGICRRILREEAQHLLFQASTLASLQRRRPAWLGRLTWAAQHVLLAGTCVTVWSEHGPVLRRGGMNFLSFVLNCRGLLRHVHNAARIAGERYRLNACAAETRFVPTGLDTDHGTGSLADDWIEQ